MKFGARIVKTGIAVCLAYWTCYLLGLNPAIYAAIAAVLTVQPSVYRSWQHFLEQIQANFIGAIVGVLFASLFGHSPIIIGIAIIVVIGINLQLRFDKTIEVSIVTVIVIMESTNSHYLLFAGNRFLIIMMGILSSLLVNALFLPPKYEQKLWEQIVKNHEQFSLLLRFRLAGEFSEKSYRMERKNAYDLLQKTIELYRLYQEEKHYVRKGRFRFFRKMVILGQMIECNRQARNTLKNLEKLNTVQDRMNQDIRETLYSHIDFLTQYHDRIMLRFNGTFRPKATLQDGQACSVEDLHLIEKMMEQYREIHPDIQAPYMSAVGEMLEYASELRRLDHMVVRYVKQKMALKS